jgi:hypothetical protein
MNRIQDYSGMIVRQVDTANTHWSENLGVSRAGKAIICVSLFSVIIFVSLACCVAVLLRAFPG